MQLFPALCEGISKSYQAWLFLLLIVVVLLKVVCFQVYLVGLTFRHCWKHCWNWLVGIAYRMVIDFPEFSGYLENDAFMAVILFSEAWYPIRCVGDLSHDFSAKSCFCLCSLMSNIVTNFAYICHIFSYSLKMCWRISYVRPKPVSIHQSGTSLVFVDDWVKSLHLFVCATCGGTTWTLTNINWSFPVFEWKIPLRSLCFP